MKYFHKINTKRIDYVILSIMMLLIASGLYCIYQVEQFGTDKEGLFKNQLIGLILGLIVILVIQFFDYRFICSLSPLMYIGIVGILAYTFKYGTLINHVRRWIRIGGISFQPSELTKIILILFLAYLCNVFRDKQKKFYPLFILAGATAIPILLILKEPHLSPCIVLLLILGIIVLTSGISYKVIVTVVLVSAPILATLFIGVGMLHWNIPVIKPYMVQRVIDFVAGKDNEGEESAETAAGKYQQNNSLAAIRSGGTYGKALSQKQQMRTYANLYSNESDFIFAVVAEEYGFVGCCILLFLYLLLVIRCLLIAAHAPDLMGRIICTAVSAMFTFQAFINIGVATDILPNTGMPFPFITYGLTSLVSSMIGIGLVLDIGQQSSR